MKNISYESKKTIIVPHIPKCAGSTLKQQLVEDRNLNIFLDYDHPPHHNNFHAKE
jgi:hypothetical protein